MEATSSEKYNLEEASSTNTKYANYMEEASSTKTQSANLEEASLANTQYANLEEASSANTQYAIYSSYEDETFLQKFCLFYDTYQTHSTTKRTILVSRYKNHGGECPMQLYSSIFLF